MGSEQPVETAALRKPERQLSLFAPACESGGGVRASPMPASYQLLGLAEGVLHVREAETGHGDELAHHRHKLVSQLLRPLLLVIELLNTGQGEEQRKEGVKKPERCRICLSDLRDSHSPHSSSRCAGC